MARLASKKSEEIAVAEALSLLQQTGVRVSVAELMLAFTDALHQMMGPQEATVNQQGLTAREKEILRAGGFETDNMPDGLDDAITRTTIEYATLLATSLSVAETARLLQVDDSRIRQRLAARALYGLKVAHSWRLPAFQFEASRIISGVDKVFPRLSTDLHPIAIYTWFTSPDPDLVIEDTSDNEVDEPVPLSPRDWLLSGGNADVVANIAASL